MKKLSDDMRNKMLKLYSRGELSVSEISKQFNITSTNVINTAKRHGIYKPRTKNHHINSDIFQTITSEEQAYWLGFFSADGSMSKYSFAVTLGAKDLNHLEKMKKFFSSSHPIKKIDNNGYPAFLFQFSNKKITDDIRKLGIKENKTKTLISIPKTIPKNLTRHYIRGIFDGDGCFSVSRIGNHRKLRFILISNMFMAQSIQNELIASCDLNKTKLRIPKHSTTSAYIEYTGNKQLKRIYDYLYFDSTIYLNRKKEIADNIFNTGPLFFS